MKYCFVFVCQQGELEIKAMLLAASLKQNLRCEYELVAALPRPEATWGRPSSSTLNLLGRLGVRMEPIENPIGADYPIGNKLSCLSVPLPKDTEKIVFLDSDILCLSQFVGDRRFEEWEVNVKPADLATFGSDLPRWRQAYAACGAPMPAWTVSASVSLEQMPPYYNAGFVAVNRSVALGPEWISCARKIDSDTTVPDKRPWLDQIALPVALARLGVTPDCLDERFNYPAHLKPIDPRNPPWFVHYHSPEVLRAEPAANALVVDLASEFDDLHQAMRASPAWRGLLESFSWASHGTTTGSDHLRPNCDAKPNLPANAAKSPSLIITGIPRSGTSYLCKLIHAVKDCVVVNEPPGVFGLLADERNPWGVATYYRDLRRDIRDGKSIANKLHGGEFIEDTAQIDTVEQYIPGISRPDFLLGTKNTLAYLARLPRLMTTMGNARIVACIRHPLDVIASWKTTFQHLARADFEAQVVGNSRDAVLSELQRERLREIASTVSLPRRRALAWRYLAGILLEHRAQIELIRYEDLVANPADALNRIFASTPDMFTPDFGAGTGPSLPRDKRGALDEEDLAAISELCKETAAHFGYDASTGIVR